MRDLCFDVAGGTGCDAVAVRDMCAGGTGRVAVAVRDLCFDVAGGTGRDAVAVRDARRIAGGDMRPHRHGGDADNDGDTGCDSVAGSAVMPVPGRRSLAMSVRGGSVIRR
ncbi:hypothetical protein [Arthrobacter sp. UYCu723]